MRSVESSDTVSEIVTRTGEYFECVETAIRVLSDLIETYRADAGAHTATVDRLGEIESECDAILADIRSLVANVMDPNFTELYLLSGEVIKFYETADAVVDHAETFGNELAATSPTFAPPIRAGLTSMAELAHDATVHLSRAATIEIRNLAETERATDVSRETEQIRILEGRCDDRKNEVMQTVFDSQDRVEALLVRELVRELDEVPNAAEDAADQLRYLHAKRT